MMRLDENLDALPWAAILLDRDGVVVGRNEMARARLDGAATGAVGTRLACG